LGFALACLKLLSQALTTLLSLQKVLLIVSWDLATAILLYIVAVAIAIAYAVASGGSSKELGSGEGR